MVNNQFNDVQISLLRLLDRPITEQEVIEIKDLLVSYFDKKLKTQIEFDIIEKGINEADFEALRKGTKPSKIVRNRHASSH
ncbi:hypothetical protein [Emticicia sp. W12TSBA100-4]|uniref:hypothetical protein n=1 Tax=Emticicia sp. W12TSBA100-4 TaxID=3160965 RepID=UPI0033062861